MRKPVPAVPILAMEGPLPEKMAAFILSDLPPPLQKHHDSLNTPIVGSPHFKTMWDIPKSSF